MPAVLPAAFAVAWFFTARSGHEDVHRIRLPADPATALAAALVLVNLPSFVVGRVAR